LENPKHIKKILFVLGGLSVGGTETYLLRLCRFIRNSEDYRPLDIAIIYNETYSALVGEFRQLNVRLFPCCGNPARSFSAVADVLKCEPFDAVCCFAVPVVLPLQQAKAKGVPLRIAFLRVRRRAGLLLQKKIPFSSFFERILIAWEKKMLPQVATYLFSNSQTALDEMCGKSSTLPAAVIRNGNEFPAEVPSETLTVLRQRLGIPADAKVVGHIAAFRPQKNHPSAVRIAERICSQRQDTVFLFVGEGTEKGIPPLIKNRDVAERILAFEPQRDIFNVLRLLDVFLLPSFSEGQSNALMEAMGGGVPFVVSNCPENVELLPPNFENYAFAPTDVDGFARYIETILDKGWTHVQRENASQHARKLGDSEKNFRLFLEYFYD
jgi:glycosyltransferase involved in cell wall biosynthesis